MTMPVLPALMGDTSAAGPSLVDIISQLDDAQVSELMATAEAAGFGAEPTEPAEEAAEGEPPAGDPAEEAAEQTEDTEEADDTEAEPSEQDVEAVAAQGFESITAWCDQANESLNEQLASLEELKTSADAAVEAGADPDSIEPLLEQAQGIVEQAEIALEECHSAADSGDAHGCALAALKVERFTRVMTKLVEQAQAYAEATAAPEAGFYDEPAVKLWATRTGPKPGPML